MTSAAQAQSFFTQKTENLGGLGNHQPCYDPKHPNAEGCYTHYVVMADLDGDKDLDLIFAAGGAYYQPDPSAMSGYTGAAPLIAYLNDGAGNFTLASAAFGDFAGRTRQITVGDVDGDGDADVYVPQAYGAQPDGIQDAFFINDGQNPPHFTDESAARLPITSRAGATRFGDVDNDGDLDLVVSDWGTKPPGSPGTAHIYLNDGTGHFTEKLNAVPQDTSNIGTGPIDLDFFDADGDLDLDMVFASRQGDSLLFLNDGTGTFTNANNQFAKQLGPYVYGPDECDVDGDGDLDVWLDNAGPGGAHGTTQLLINDGTGHFVDETVQRVNDSSAADDNQARCVDINGDGHLDMVVASLSGPERILLNNGSGHFDLDPGAFSTPPVIDSTLGLDLGDTNGDHLLDAITAQGESGAFLNRFYLGTSPQLPDTLAPVFRQVEKLADGIAAGKAVVRFAVSDNATTDVGPRLQKAYIEIVGGAIVPATFMGGDLFRAVIDVAAGPATTYHACAVDQAGNKGCSADITVIPAGGATSSSTGTGTGTGASTGAGGGGGGAASSSVTSAADGSSGSTGATGAGGGGGSGDGSSSGCGCAVPGQGRAGTSLSMLLAAAAIGALARRRRARR